MGKLDIREALKISIAVPAALLIALWLGWEKAYWAAATVVILATNESFGHSIKTGKERILGAALGSILAVILVALFPQSPIYFMTTFIAVSSILIYLSGCQYHGYLFKMALTVCTLIAMVGGLDNVATFQIAVTRLQETILGVLVFTFVYTFLGQQETQQLVKSSFEDALEAIRKKIVSARYPSLFDKSSTDVEFSTAKKRLISLLSLPLNGSHDLASNKKNYQILLAALIESAEREIESPESEQLLIHRYSTIKRLLTQNAINDCSSKTLPALLGLTDREGKALIKQTKPTLTVFTNYQARFMTVLQNACIVATSFLIWIHLPVPGGTTFPMLACVLANSLVTMPKSMIKHVIGGFLVFSVVILIQFVLIMPVLTEAWQLAAFYFANLFCIWLICDILKQPLQKMLGGQLLVVLTNGTLHLTPTYDIQTPIIMIILVFMSLAICKFFIDLIQPEVLFPHRISPT
ncbi:FUSC family protein [Vibrio sp. E150_011]